ncbi:MAG: DEAD/DEAH box helicase [Boseongicola sp. SB0670_bin_30]|nr:DEAD/DEAH box helicase [Boseongicola sp. SB0670_bin_30]
MPLTEADTCRMFVVPSLQEAGWETRPHSINEQRTFTDGRILLVGERARRGRQKRADYILRYRPDFPIAVVEAKARYKRAEEGMQQAKDYAEILGFKFAYATNGTEIIEFDFTTGIERAVSQFPVPDELWQRLKDAEDIDNDIGTKLLAPGWPDRTRPLRYYQEIAVNRAVQAALQGRRRILLTLCTGSGKTSVAFQICWKLWSARWNRKGSVRRPKILFLADRNVLVDDPMAKDFAPFGDARMKIVGEAVKSRDMCFAIYQAIARDENRPGLYREYPPDFFDLVVVDECHRGSARDDSNWREILEWFEPACQIGMTATPRRTDNVDTYDYFGNPLYQYSLAQGISDGFLAPWRVHRVITDYDAAGWRPNKGERDRFGREIPDSEYGTPDFERKIVLKARTRAIARHLTTFLRQTDRFAKTIVFCVDQEHALDMRHAIAELNPDIVKENPDYVCRVTADEGDIGSAHRARFQDVETRTPTVLTTSQLLTTGVDAPTCKNVVLVRVVGSMPEFKQIIGRGTRLRPDYGKLAFNIVDYTGTATQKFADPDFDGDPAYVREETINAEGETVDVGEPDDESDNGSTDWPGSGTGTEQGSPPEIGPGAGSDAPPRKYYVDGGEVEVLRHLVYELDADGRKLACRHLTDYAGDVVRTLYPVAADLRRRWLDTEQRTDIVEQLAECGVDLGALRDAANQPEADAFDLLCHLAYNAPLRTRRERAERLRREEPEFFGRFGPEAREVLDALIEKYAVHGAAQFKLPEILEVPPFNDWGNVVEIATRFGGGEHLREAVRELQCRLYAA